MSNRQDSRKQVAAAGVSVITEPLRLATLGTATYLSYWTLFFAVCRACSGRRS